MRGRCADAASIARDVAHVNCAGVARDVAWDVDRAWRDVARDVARVGFRWIGVHLKYSTCFGILGLWAHYLFFVGKATILT